MQEEPLFHPAGDDRAPGLRTVSSSENLPGGVPASGGSSAFYRVQPEELMSGTASGQDYQAGIPAHRRIPRSPVTVCRGLQASSPRFALHQLIKGGEIWFCDRKSSAEVGQLNLLFRRLMNEES